jgi:hypothetical protein
MTEESTLFITGEAGEDGDGLDQPVECMVGLASDFQSL